MVILVPLFDGTSVVWRITLVDMDWGVSTVKLEQILLEL
jgi:hypothetical protein